MTKNILLVDDDLDDSELFCEAIGEIDNIIVCHRATNGIDGLKLIKEHGKPFVIFMDINMPGMDGYECLTHLKADTEYKDIPVVMYSTSSHEMEMEKAAKLGAAHFLIKPNSYSALRESIKLVVDNIEDPERVIPYKI